MESDHNMYHCSNEKCPLEEIWMPYWEWNRRPGEDRARAEGLLEAAALAGTDCDLVMELERKSDAIRQALEDGTLPRASEEEREAAIREAWKKKREKIGYPCVEEAMCGGQQMIEDAKGDPEDD